MAFQSSTEEIGLCFPLCCLGVVEPSKLVFYCVLWDVFIFVSYFFYNIAFLESMTIAPLIVCFLLVLTLFPVVWDIRDPSGKFTILRVYSYIRIFQATAMTLLGMASFILIFVYIANPNLESPLLHRYLSVGLFAYLLPASIVHWGTVLSFMKAVKLMRSINMNQVMNTRLNLTLGKLDTTQSFLIPNPTAQNKVELSRIQAISQRA